MKKGIFIVAAVLAACSAALSGCNQTDAPDNVKGVPEPMKVERDDDCDDDDCKNPPEMPDIGFREPRRKPNRPVPLPAKPITPKN